MEDDPGNGVLNMLPNIIDIGPIKLSSFGVFAALGFLWGSFWVWKQARDKGMPENKVFDSIIFVTLAAFVGARIGFVVSHWEIFSSNVLRIFLPWNYSGFSMWGALLFGILTFTFYGKKQKISLPILGDCYGSALPIVTLFLSIAVLLDGSLVGKRTLHWGFPAVGESGYRHPVGIYAILFSLLYMILIYALTTRLSRKSMRSGALFLASLGILGIFELILALFRDNLLYLREIPVEGALSLVLVLGSLTLLYKTSGSFAISRKIKSWVGDVVVRSFKK